nr:unnamed protein product [Callosobruchus analis]
MTVTGRSEVRRGTAESRKLYTPEQLLLLYRAQIRPSLEYCSHVWGCAPKHSLKLLDSIQNRAVKLIDTDNLTKDLHSLEHRRRVAGLSLFYRFYHGRCSSELSQIITPKAVRTRNTRETLHAHPYQVEVPTPRTSLLQHSFFWKTWTLWNELPGKPSLIQTPPSVISAACIASAARGLKLTSADAAVLETCAMLNVALSINNNMSWHDHVATIAKTASQKLGVLFRCRKLYTPEQLLLLYKAQIRPSLEYCSHVWGCAPKRNIFKSL